MKLLATLFFSIILFSISSKAQEDVVLKHDYDAVGNAHIRAYNYTGVPIYIALDFTLIENTSLNEDLPIIKRVEPMISEFQELMSDSNMLKPVINYVFSWYRAHPSPKIDKGFPYLLPIARNKKTSVFHVSNLSGFNGSEISGKWYSLSFTVEGSNTIHAVRKGQVVKVVSNVTEAEIDGSNYTHVNNFLHVLHEDGTIAEYTNFAVNGIDKAIGNIVYPGEILGKVNPSIQPTPYVGLTIFHSKLNSKDWKTIIPGFYTLSEGSAKILAPESYTSEYSNKIIGFEMTRKEKKKFLK